MPPSTDPEVLTTSALFSAIMPIKISMYDRLGGYAKELNISLRIGIFGYQSMRKILLELKLIKFYIIEEIMRIM